MSERSFFEFLSIWEKFKYVPESHSRRKWRMEFIYSGMFEVIIWGNKAELSGHHIGFTIVSFISLNTFGAFKFVKDLINSFLKPTFDWFIVIRLKSIIIRIFKYSSKHERPSDPFDTVSGIVDLSSGDLCINVILKLLL